MKLILVGDTEQTLQAAIGLSQTHHDVTLISNDMNLCTRYAEVVDHYAVHGDGRRPEILRQAGIRKCEALVSVSEQEEECLVVCEVAIRLFSIKKAVAVAPHLRNIHLFREMGINCLSGDATALTDALSFLLISHGYIHAIPIGIGKCVVMDIEIASDNPWIGRPANDYPLPEEARRICLMHMDGAPVDDMTSRLTPGDHVMALVRSGKAGEAHVQKYSMAQSEKQ